MAGLDLTRRLGMLAISFGLVLLSVWIPVAAEFFILVPLAFKVTDPCSLPNMLNQSDASSVIQTLSYVAAFGFISGKQLVFTAAVPAMMYLLPTHFSPSSLLVRRFVFCALSVLTVLIFQLGIFSGFYGLVKLMGSHRNQAQFHFRLMNSAPLGILVLVDKRPGGSKSGAARA